MRPHEIESWALRVIDFVERRLPNEDSRIELKSAWIEPQKAARQIAAHANAARGEPILWIIGVDQQRGVTGASHTELANWYAGVQAQFDGLAPELTDLIVPTKSMVVVALLFNTERAPFVVKNPAFGQVGGGSVQYEVPWRENTSTRTATRSELIKLLSPLQKLPDFEILSATLDAEESPTETSNKFEQLVWALDLEMYVVPKAETRVVIPYHKLHTTFEVRGTSIKAVPMGTGFVLPGLVREHGVDPGVIRMTESEVIIDGPGRVRLSASATTELVGQTLPGPARVEVVLVPAGAEVAASLSAELANVPATGSKLGKWKLR